MAFLAAFIPFAADIGGALGASAATAAAVGATAVVGTAAAVGATLLMGSMQGGTQGTPSTPSVPDPAVAAQKAQEASDARRRSILNAGGNTNITGGGAMIQPGQTQMKTLLGG